MSVDRLVPRALRSTLLLGCALVSLVAVVLMHGPSSDHMLFPPVRAAGHGMAMSHGADPAPPAAVDQTHRSSISTVGDTEVMRHADCVATLRSDPSVPVPFDAVIAGAPESGAKTRATQSPTGTTLRGPPRPSLDRLCISRT